MSLPTVLITHTLGFVEPNVLPRVAEVSKLWNRGTIPRIRTSAAAAIQAFTEYLQTRLEPPELRDRFFAQCNLEPFQDPRFFMRCDGIRDIQPLMEEIRRNVEIALVEVHRHYHIFHINLDPPPQETDFNYGLEKTFFLAEIRSDLQSMGNFYQSELAGQVHYHIRTLSAHHCGMRALEVMHTHPVLLRFQHRLSVALKVDWRTEGYISLALGFVDRKDLRAASEMIDLLPTYLSRDFEGLSDDLLAGSKYKMKVAVLSAIFQFMILDGQREMAYAIRDSIGAPPA